MLRAGLVVSIRTESVEDVADVTPNNVWVYEKKTTHIFWRFTDQLWPTGTGFPFATVESPDRQVDGDKNLLSIEKRRVGF